MTELLTAAQMRALERDEIESGAVTGLALMERAGQGVVDAIFAQWPELAAPLSTDTEEGAAADVAQSRRRAMVLCGPGNNGGDGFVIARMLKARGWAVDTFLYGDPARLPPDARANHDRWAAEDPVSLLVAVNVQRAPRPDLIVDAVFGIGLTRPVPPEVDKALAAGGDGRAANLPAIRRVAVDCPSGLNLDTGMVQRGGGPVDPDFGRWPATVSMADLTVTFHSPKPGHYLGQGPALCGVLKVVDIGLGGDALERGMIGVPPDADRVRLVEPVHMGRPLPGRIWPGALIAKARHAGHKYDHGHVVVFAGGVGRGGAGRMAARAALRAGAGLVTLVCPPAALQENACRLDAVMLRAVRGPEHLGDVADDRVTGFVIGPGMGVSERTRGFVRSVLARRAGDRDWRDPVVVLDADGLSSFAADPKSLFERTHARCVLTPHDGEFARLFPDLAPSRRGAMSKIDAVRAAADRAGCVILLKGADTVIARPGGGASLHAAAYDRAAPWLATAGAGDVLAGLIAGLSASGLAGDLFNVVEAAAWLHVEAARSFGPGLIAEDLTEELPKVLRGIGL